MYGRQQRLGLLSVIDSPGRVGAALAVVFAMSAWSPLGATADAKSWRVELDGDTPRETVAVKKRRCRNPYPCTQLVLRDGKRRKVLTSASQRPRFPYYWRVERVRFRDLTGDGLPEIAWELFTSGGTGSSPSSKGVDQWNGQRATRIFRFDNYDREPPPDFEYVIGVLWRIVDEVDGGLAEIETSESLHKSDDGTCCPSAYRVMRHRWDGTRIAPVPGSETIEDA